MNQQQTEQYQKQQKAKEREEMLEKSKGFDFINLMLRSIGMGERK